MHIVRRVRYPCRALVDFLPHTRQGLLTHRRVKAAGVRIALVPSPPTRPTGKLKTAAA